MRYEGVPGGTYEVRVILLGVDGSHRPQGLERSSFFPWRGDRVVVRHT